MAELDIDIAMTQAYDHSFDRQPMHLRALWNNNAKPVSLFFISKSHMFTRSWMTVKHSRWRTVTYSIRVVFPSVYPRVMQYNRRWRCHIVFSQIDYGNATTLAGLIYMQTSAIDQPTTCPCCTAPLLVLGSSIMSQHFSREFHCPWVIERIDVL